MTAESGWVITNPVTVKLCKYAAGYDQVCLTFHVWKPAFLRKTCRLGTIVLDGCNVIQFHPSVSLQSKSTATVDGEVVIPNLILDVKHKRQTSCNMCFNRPVQAVGFLKDMFEEVPLQNI